MTRKTSSHSLLPFAVLAGLAFVLPGFAHAVGETSEYDTCKPGQIYDAMQRDCIPLEGAPVSERNRVRYAYALAKEGRYEEAIRVLDTMVDPNTAEALNYRGYATRKLGRTEEGIGYYLRSVAMAPDYASVREYLGEAYITLGRIDLAREQLKQVERICGTQCEEYEDLAEALEKAGK